MNSRLLSSVLLGVIALTLLGASGEEWNRYFIQADQALLLQKYDEAIGNYRQGTLHGSSGEDPKTWDDLGYAFLQKKNAKNAIGYCQKALEHCPEDYDLHLYLAIAYFLDHRPEKAQEELRDIEDDVYFNAAWIGKTSGFTVRNTWGDELANEQLERLRWEKGVHLRTESPHSAVLYLDAFDERNEAAFYFFQGLVLAQLNEPARAEKMLQLAVKAGYPPQDVESGRSRAPEEIPLRLHHRLKGHDNGLAWSLHEKFLGQLDQGRVLEGIETLQEALDIDEQSFEINHNLALLYYDLGDLDHAGMYCARALWVREGDAACHELMGNIDFSQNAYNRAVYEFERMITIDPEDPHGYYNLGSTLSRLNDPARAEVQWRKAIDLDRSRATGKSEKRTADGKQGYSVVAKKASVAYLANLALGKLFSGQGRLEQAIAEFEAAAGRRPDDPSPYLDLAKLYQRTKERAKAVACLDKYLYLGGVKDGEARELLEYLKKR